MIEKITFDELPNVVANLRTEIGELKILLLNKTKEQSAKEIERLLSVEEAAVFLNLSVPTIYSKVSKGELPYMKKSKRLYFSSTELLKYIKQGRVKTNSELELEAEMYLNNNDKGGANEK